MIITGANLLEDINTAFHNVFSFYFTGAPAGLQLGAEIVKFKLCEFFFVIDHIENHEGDKPAIGIVGSRGSFEPGGSKKMKCGGGYQMWENHKRSFFVKVLGERHVRSDGVSVASAEMLAEEIWSHCSLIVNTQAPRFRANSLYNVALSSPVQVPDIQEAVLRGEIAFQTRVAYLVDALPSSP